MVGIVAREMMSLLKFQVYSQMTLHLASQHLPHTIREGKSSSFSASQLYVLY